MSKILTPDSKTSVTEGQKTTAIIGAIAATFGAAIAIYLQKNPEKLKELKSHVSDAKDKVIDAKDKAGFSVGKSVDSVKYHVAKASETVKGHVNKFATKVKDKFTKKTEKKIEKIAESELE